MQYLTMVLLRLDEHYIFSYLRFLERNEQRCTQVNLALRYCIQLIFETKVLTTPKYLYLTLGQAFKQFYNSFFTIDLFVFVLTVSFVELFVFVCLLDV